MKFKREPAVPLVSNTVSVECRLPSGYKERNSKEREPRRQVVGCLEDYRGDSTEAVIIHRVLLCCCGAIFMCGKRNTGSHKGIHTVSHHLYYQSVSLFESHSSEIHQVSLLNNI